MTSSCKESGTSAQRSSASRGQQHGHAQGTGQGTQVQRLAQRAAYGQRLVGPRCSAQMGKSACSAPCSDTYTLTNKAEPMESAASEACAWRPGDDGVRHAEAITANWPANTVRAWRSTTERSDIAGGQRWGGRRVKGSRCSSTMPLAAVGGAANGGVERPVGTVRVSAQLRAGCRARWPRPATGTLAHRGCARRAA